MRVRSLVTLVSLSLTAMAMQAQAAETRYYDPSNAASETGFTSAHDLYRTIGCPGKGLLDAPCKVPVEVKAAPVAAPVPAPAPKPVPAPAPKDSDGDGVIDDKDRCPATVAGAKVDANGCELDADGDGVVDRLDTCPNTPAGRKVNAQGCELDGDKDGIVDGVDQCPDTPAGDKVDSKGCTLLNTIVLKGVSFDDNSAVLRAEASAILDEQVATLKRYPTLKVEIAGHTDSNNTDAYNQRLSEQRAKAVMEYFVGKGVAAEQLTAKGYGESEPVADNASAEGRAQNRRVELRVLN